MASISYEERALAAAPSASERIALLVVQIGVLATVFAASTHKEYELDRFLIPKELVLHMTAALGALFAFGALRRMRRTGVDWIFAAWLILGALSAVLAINPWLGFRAFAVSASAVMMFWLGRALRNGGMSRTLLTAVAVAIVAVATTALLQAYGIRTEFFSLNRSPGGTTGNRNFVGHIAAFGLPVVILMALRARSLAVTFIASLGTALVTAALVLTRSRAAWLACIVVVILTLFALLLAPSLRRHGATWGRLVGIALIAGGAVAAALMTPNSLQWRSDNPYLESIAGVTNYEEGSGRGRLVQYERSLAMAMAHPLLGVGPGNWPVVYPEFAARRDPSLDRSEAGMTANPWPSSDWIAFISERGFAAAALKALAIGLLAFSAVRRLLTTSGNPDDALEATALIGTLAGAVITGLFDAVLLLGLPTLIVWTAVGALWEPSAFAPRPRLLPIVLILPIVVVSLAGLARSSAQLAAMEISTSSSGRDALSLATSIDPGNYRVHLRLARDGPKDQRCNHARAARDLFPRAGAARSLARGCGE
jgi:O-antigen ligase